MAGSETGLAIVTGMGLLASGIVAGVVVVEVDTVPGGGTLVDVSIVTNEPMSNPVVPMIDVIITGSA